VAALALAWGGEQVLILRREQGRRGELLRSLISAQENERKRIARELHDETSQGLSVLIVSLETIAMELARGGCEASRSLQTARSVAQSVLEGVRRLISDLRPSLLDDLGLVPAIAWCAERRLEALGIEVGLQCELPEDVRLPSVVETALFRIAQEAISNIAQHSQASTVAIALRVAGGRAVLRIEDDGRGFEPELAPAQAAAGRGLGLQGMRERTHMLGGQFRLRTAPGQGTSLRIDIPLTMGENGDA
jgi:signal transduction histidine kinase